MKELSNALRDCDVCLNGVNIHYHLSELRTIDNNRVGNNFLS